MGRMNPMTMLQIFREINSLLNMFKARKSQTAVSDINFTGQHTDIALVAENGKLNAEEIEKITDNQLRENVQKSFSEAVQNGYLDYDAKTRDFTVTQKGLEHINSEAFMKQFEKDRLQKLSENKAQVNLRGNGTDLNVFRFTDSISLNHLAHTDPVAFKRVQEYFYECEKYGIDPRKVSTVHNAVEPLAHPEEFKKPERKDKLVTFLGRITMQKGPEYFVEAAARVLSKTDGVRFVMAGSGDKMAEMIDLVAKRGIADKFHFPGFMRGKQVQEMLAMSDVYIMPSVSEPFGISPLEAMQVGCPSIISHQSGCAEILQHAIKTDYWDIDAMADAIYAIVKYPAMYKSLHELGMAEVNNIKWSDAGLKVRRIYDGVINHTL